PLHRIAARHGFEAIVEPVRLSPWERVHLFGENILYWLLALACNSGRARPNKFWRSRQLIYLSRRVLDCKHIAATRGHLTPVLQNDENMLLRVRVYPLRTFSTAFVQAAIFAAAPLYLRSVCLLRSFSTAFPQALGGCDTASRSS